MHMKAWSIAINNGTADLETVPKALATTFMTSKPGAKHPLCETIQKTPAKEPHLTLSVPQTPSPFSQPYPLPPPYYPPHLNNTPQYPQYALPYMYPPPGNPPKEIQQGARQRSSSLPSEYRDLMNKLEEYFLWLTKIASGMKEQLNEWDVPALGSLRRAKGGRASFFFVVPLVSPSPIRSSCALREYRGKAARSSGSRPGAAMR